jgi:hypothetical protein
MGSPSLYGALEIFMLLLQGNLHAIAPRQSSCYCSKAIFMLLLQGNLHAIA